MQLTSSPLLVLAASTSIFSATHAHYTLIDSYTAANWFQSFLFYDKEDPTHGFVQYKNLADAAKNGLISIDSSTSEPAVYMGVDHTSKNPAGRDSVRISSKKSFNHGLFIFDIEHTPSGICGTWPAAWLLSDSGAWPKGGEIDIFEGANDQAYNKMTLHTSPDCAIQHTGFSGDLETANCDVNAAGQGKNMGCGIRHPMAQGLSFGQGMNKIGGGIYATVWTSTDIQIFHFPRADVPADIATPNPDPSKWGMPVAKFSGAACNIDAHFQNLNIIFNTAFCGDWAGEAWSSSPTCKAKAPTCEQYVRDNPGVFGEAYWLIRSVKVYEDRDSVVDRRKSKRSRAGFKKAVKGFFGHDDDDDPDAVVNAGRPVHA
ncbi:MAG: hypothetical protein L6R37_007932 [Teloschistes peruensis]|nr:MAG: hypothetical protein L6R37_007932 [Teloschistes peruensis]